MTSLGPFRFTQLGDIMEDCQEQLRGKFVFSSFNEKFGPDGRVVVTCSVPELNRNGTESLPAD